MSYPVNSPTADLIIFDCDGVLVDSEPLVNRVYADMLAEAGYVVDYEESLREFAGAAMSARLQVLSQRLGWSPPPEFPAQFGARLDELFADALRPVEGVAALLERLSASATPFCVASNGTRKEITFRLETCGLFHYFEKRIFSGVETPRPKPWPDVFLSAAAAFDVMPMKCVVIEDSVTGVTAATRAGMQVIGHAAHTDAAQLIAAGAARTVANMHELSMLLEQGPSP